MHQNLAFHSGLSNNSETADSIKQDRFVIQGLPFSLSMINNSPLITRSASTRSIWTNSEKQRYSIFAFYFRQVLASLPTETMNWNVFKGMAKFIQTRNPHQCRSHHLKLIRQFEGIQKFLSCSIKRIHRLKRKMHQAKPLFTKIQDQFQIYVEDSQLFPEKNNFSVQNSLIKGTEIELQVVESQEKMEKEDLKKTADSYEYNQNPVKNNIFVGSLPGLKPYKNLKTKPKKQSLPSFDNDEKFSGKCMNSNLLVQQIDRKPINNCMNFSISKVSFEGSPLNFNTFNAPDHIKTTSQMYKLWQNSYDGLKNGLERRINKSEEKQLN